MRSIKDHERRPCETLLIHARGNVFVLCALRAPHARIVASAAAPSLDSPPVPLKIGGHVRQIEPHEPPDPRARQLARPDELPYQPPANPQQLRSLGHREQHLPRPDLPLSPFHLHGTWRHLTLHHGTARAEFWTHSNQALAVVSFRSSEGNENNRAAEKARLY